MICVFPIRWLYQQHRRRGSPPCAEGVTALESRDFKQILNAIPETGVYVIREDDHGILYFNKKVQEVSPEIRFGMACHEAWAGSCHRCPLLSIGGRQESHSVGYNAPYGGVVDITATRTLWEGTTPAFVLNITPRKDSGGYTYRKILHVDLDLDHCDVLKSDPEGWQPGDGSLSRQLELFARSGAVHPEDVERFVAFTRLEYMRSASSAGQEALTLIYRRRTADAYRWNLMELIADPDSVDMSVILCVKDVHDVLREGLEREGLSVRSRELIRSLGERNFSIYTVDLNSGSADLIRVDGRMCTDISPAALPWSELMRVHIKDRLHEAYLDEFERRFSLEGLRQAWADGLQETELLCQWRSGGDYRYISVTAYFNREPTARSYSVLALQDVDERMRQELAHTERDMRMAAAVKSRFSTMNTVYLDSGRYEWMDLTQPAGSENTRAGDYRQFIQNELSTRVYPDDEEKFWTILSLEHLREKAGTTEDYAEEVCLYRQRGEPVRWIELRVIYARQEDQVLVNILGQDVTREKRQEESRLQALEERAYVISSLSSLFFATYYINVEADTFRAVAQLRRVEDVLGEEVNCTAAMQLYANHFIHPDDRAEYLNVMNAQNLRQTLRWWQPVVAVEYRKMPDDPNSVTWSWVRATAVLARTGPDDMPKTVVYVAQDITTGPRLNGGANGSTL